MEQGKHIVSENKWKDPIALISSFISGKASPRLYNPASNELIFETCSHEGEAQEATTNKKQSQNIIFKDSSNFVISVKGSRTLYF
eukprot:373329-Ditylum_brightwellii.AAC.1